MTVQEDILAELTAEPFTKIIGELGQGDKNILQAELAEGVVKIKTTDDLVDKGCKYGFLVLVPGQTEYGKVIGNETVQLTIPEDLGRYDDSIQAKDIAFDRSKSEKKHTRKVIEYEKFLGAEVGLCTLILQAVEGLYLKALKEEYIGYDNRTPK